MLFFCFSFLPDSGDLVGRSPDIRFGRWTAITDHAGPKSHDRHCAALIAANMGKVLDNLVGSVTNKPPVWVTTRNVPLVTLKKLGHHFSRISSRVLTVNQQALLFLFHLPPFIPTTAFPASARPVCVKLCGPHPSPPVLCWCSRVKRRA